MVYVATNIGHIASSSGTTAVLSVPGGVPAGATILVGVRENTTTTLQTAGEVVDSAGNVYQLAKTLASGTGVVGVWYCQNCLAIASGGSITYTKKSSSDATLLEGGYVTGLGTYDSAALGSNSNSSAVTTLTTTSGVPSVAGEFFLAFTGMHASSTVTNDSNWTTPPLDSIASTPGALSGYRTNAGTGALTYVANWTSAAGGAVVAGIIIGFKPPAVAGGFNMPMMGF